jgi:hypothetical protein
MIVVAILAMMVWIAGLVIVSCNSDKREDPW